MEPLPCHQLRDLTARQSLDHGCETAIEPWRLAATNTASGKAPNAVRDQMMRHDNGAYINENAYRNEPTEDTLIAMLSHVHVMRDPRASSDTVPKEIWDQLEPDPEVLELEEQRKRLKGDRYHYHDNENKGKIQQIGQKIRTLRSRRAKVILEQYRKVYFENRPTWDTEQQDGSNNDELDMDDFDDDFDDDFHGPDIHLDIPERAELAQSVCKPPEDLSDDELTQRRIRFKEYMVAPTSKQETVRRDGVAPRAAPEVEVTDSPRSSSNDTDAIPTNTSIAKPAVDDAAMLGDPFPRRMHKFQCTECIGDGQLFYEHRTFSFTRASSRNDHFDRRHLPTLTQRLAQGHLQCTHPKCTNRVSNFRSMEQYVEHQLRVHHVKLRAVGGKAARSRYGIRKNKEPDQIVWRVGSPVTPDESFNGESVVYQAQNHAAKTVSTAEMLGVAPPV
ncbi:MAG: hypothetical protein Q9190_002260 [Brigantiaea leucoxantha]